MDGSADGMCNGAHSEKGLDPEVLADLRHIDYLKKQLRSQRKRIWRGNCTRKEIRERRLLEKAAYEMDKILFESTSSAKSQPAVVIGPETATTAMARIIELTAVRDPFSKLSATHRGLWAMLLALPPVPPNACLPVAIPSTSLFAPLQRLTKFPIPQLDLTLKWLRWHGAAYAELSELKELALEFSSTVGAALQETMLAMRAGRVGCLQEAFRRESYLKSPLPLALSPALQAVSLRPPSETLSYAAHAARLIAGLLSLRHRIATGDFRPVYVPTPPVAAQQALPLRSDVESRGGDPHRFLRLFCTTRVPGASQDTLTTDRGWGGSSILLVVREKLYLLDVLNCDTLRGGQPAMLHPKQLEDIIEELLRDGGKPAMPLGYLPSAGRREWAEVYLTCMKHNEANSYMMHRLGKTLFAVCLDTDVSPKGTPDVLREALHGSPANRWPDKSLQLVVFANGNAALVGDEAAIDPHTLLEAATECSEGVRKWTPAKMKLWEYLSSMESVTGTPWKAMTFEGLCEELECGMLRDHPLPFAIPGKFQDTLPEYLHLLVAESSPWLQLLPSGKGVVNPHSTVSERDFESLPVGFLNGEKMWRTVKGPLERPVWAPAPRQAIPNELGKGAKLAKHVYIAERQIAATGKDRPAFVSDTFLEFSGILTSRSRFCNTTLIEIAIHLAVFIMTGASDPVSHVTKVAQKGYLDSSSDFILLTSKPLLELCRILGGTEVKSPWKVVRLIKDVTTEFVSEVLRSQSECMPFTHLRMLAKVAGLSDEYSVRPPFLEHPVMRNLARATLVTMEIPPWYREVDGFAFWAANDTPPPPLAIAEEMKLTVVYRLLPSEVDVTVLAPTSDRGRIFLSILHGAMRTLRDFLK